MTGRPTQHRADRGEILPLPDALWTAADAAIATTRAARDGDPEAACRRFVGAFVEELHKAGFILVTHGRPESTQTVGVDAYSLICAAKYDAERRLASIAQLANGWPGGVAAGASGPIVDQLGRAVLALAGRSPPADRDQLGTGLLRLRAIVAIANDCGDIGQMPAFDAPLAQLLKGE